MKMRPTILSLLAVALLAQGARAGEARTDGPEGSEIGKGGYTSVNGVGTLGLELRVGAVAQANTTVDYASSKPFFLGADISYWYWDWFSLDLEANYAFSNHRFNALLGPRFRLGWFPFTLTLGLKAGAFLLDDTMTCRSATACPTSGYTPYFGLSPQVGFEFTASRHLILGLSYAADFPIGVEGFANRVYLNLGWRF